MVDAVDNSTDGFREVNIVFSVVSTDGNYNDTFEEIRTLEIIDVDATLSRLQLTIWRCADQFGLHAR